MFLLVQRDDVAVQPAVFQFHHAVGGAAGVPDAAGVQEQGLAPHVHQGLVGVAEEKQVQVLLLSGVARRQKLLLHAVGVAMAHQHPLVLQK